MTMTDSQTVPFLLDTNVFIEAHRRYYAFDIHPGFWNCLYHLFQTNQAVSLDRVRTELLGGNDELSDASKFLYPTSVSNSEWRP